MEGSLNRPNLITILKKPLQWGGGNFAQMWSYRNINRRSGHEKQIKKQQIGREPKIETP